MSDASSKPSPRDSEHQYRTLFEASADAMFLHDDQRHYIDVNLRACALYGYSREEILSHRAGTLLSGAACTEEQADEYNRRIQAGEVVQFEWVGRRKDGSTFPEEVTLSAIRIAGRMHVLATVRDITDRKRSEQALRESEERFRSLVANVPIGVFRTTPDGTILDANPALVDMLGYASAEELRTRNIEQDGYSEGSSRQDFCSRMESDGEVTGMSFAWRKKDGSTIYVSESAKAVRDGRGHIICYEGTVEDITQRTRIDRALRSIAREPSTVSGEDIFRSLARHLSSILQVRYVVIAESIGGGQARLVAFWDGRSFGDDLVHSIDGSPCARVFQGSVVHHVEGVTSQYPQDHVLQSLDAVGYLGVPLVDEAGTVLGSLCLIDDKPLCAALVDDAMLLLFVSRAAVELQREQSAEAVRKAERMYRGIFESAVEGIYQSTIDGRYITVNPMMVRILGHNSAEELTGIAADSCRRLYVKPDRRDEFVALLKARSAVTEFESQVYRRDGTIIWVSENARLMKDVQGRTLGFEGTLMDVSARKNAEAEAARRSDFEKLITGISTQFINLDLGDIDEGIDEALERIGAYVGADRSYIFVYSPDGLAMSNIHEWCDEGIEPQMANLQDVPIEAFPYFNAAMRRLQPFYMPRLADLPPEAALERAEFEAESIQSLICVPLAYGGRLAGFLGFDAVRAEASWSEHTIALLKIVGEILINALERKRAEQRLRLTQFSVDRAPDPTFWIGPDARFQYVNDAACRVLGYTREELLAMKVADIDPHMTADAWPDHWQVLRRQGTLVFESQHRPREGSDFAVEITSSFMEFDGKEYVCASAKNIAERKRAEDAVRASERRFRTLAENIPGVVYLCKNDARFTMLYLNDAVETLTGYPRQEFLEDRISFVEIFHPEDAASISGEVDRAIAAREPFHLLYRLKHRDGQYRWIEEIGVGVFHDDRLLYLEGFLSDVSKRKGAEEALQESQRTLATLMSNLPGMAYRCRNDQDWSMEFVSEGCLELTGYASADLIDNRRISFGNVIHRDDRAAVWDEVQAALTERRPFLLVYRIRTRQGILRWVWEMGRGIFSSDGELMALEGFMTDMTERKRAEEALQESEVRYRTLFEGAFNAIFLYDAEGRIVDVNLVASTLYGYSREELLAMRAGDLLSVGETGGETQAWQLLERARAGETLFFEWTGRRKDGSTFPEEVSLKPVTIQGRRYLLGLVRDFTERKQAEQALQEQRAFLRQVIDLNPNFVFAKNREGRFTLVNKAVASAYGTTVEDLIGKSDAEFNPNAEEVAHFRADDLEVMDSGREKFVAEEMITDAQGRVRYLQTVKRPISDASGHADQVLGVATDITARRAAEREQARLQARLFHAQKMESIGLLAGGIAHDFNNLLAGILGFSSVAQEELTAEHPARRSVDLISQSAEKAAKLTRELLAYARGGPRILEVFDLNTLVDEILDLLRPNLPKHVTVERYLSPDRIVVEADSGQMQQVIMNLCMNAGESIGAEPGRVTVTTRRLPASASSGKPPSGGGELVCLEVTDTGCGMTAETRDKIFEPFFSTKRFGRGMGLAAVQGIVANHEGEITVESVPGMGSTFRVVLPASDRAVQRVGGPQAAAEPGTETILVADDEEVVRKAARAGLTKLGYSVVTANDGREAVDCVRNSTPPIDLVLLDIMMPGMNGEQVLAELQDLRPDLRVLLSSGYSEQMVLEQLDAPAVKGFIQKPYTLQRLGTAVREVLDEA